MMNNTQFIETFHEEARELLGNLEQNLLELETNPNDKELLSSVFRVMHTIKGSAAMFGLSGISTFAHEVESVLSALRDGLITISRDLIDQVLHARDIILEMLETKADDVEAMQKIALESEAFLQHLKKTSGIPQDRLPSKPQNAETKPIVYAEEKTQGSRETWHIVFNPNKDVYRRGINPLKLLDELRKMGESVCIPDFTDIRSLESINPEEYTEGWNVFLTTAADENAIRDVFIFIEGDCTLEISCISHDADGELTEPKKIGEILLAQGKIDKETIDRILKSQKRIGDALLEEKLVTPITLKVALEEQRQIQKAQNDKKAVSEQTSIRIKSEKLDDLMAAVGELVSAHAQIQEIANHRDCDDGLDAVTEQLGRLTSNLRDISMDMRMIPIGGTFISFKRLVRDLSAQLGKQAELEIYGGENELDKSIIERLHDPLVHIMRNSLDHGIESPETRSERGKPSIGKIRIGAVQAGAAVNIIIEDDGNGLDRQKILEKAREKGIIQPTDRLTDEEIFKLILLPGFSTKHSVSAISGRGVGMDVVNRQMEEIGGRIGIESVEEKGSKMTLTIPLTLAIIDGLLIRAGEEYFIIPLQTVTGCLESRRNASNNSNSIIVYQGNQLPCIDLRDFFGIPGEPPEIGQIVVISLKETNYGLRVDQIIGNSQAVIKPLGSIYRDVQGISSATIRGNGSIALILDVEQIIETVTDNKKRSLK